MDGGHTWKFMGLKETQQIGRIIVHPTNPNIVYVAALGHAWGPNAERGLAYKTVRRRKYLEADQVRERQGGVHRCRHGSEQPQHALCRQLGAPARSLLPHLGRPRWAPHSTRAPMAATVGTEVKGNGFPETMKGRIGLTFAHSNPRIIYASVEADSLRGTNHALRAPASDSAGGRVVPAKRQRLLSGLYRSDDGGTTWRWMNDNDTRPFYYFAGPRRYEKSRSRVLLFHAIALL